MSNIIRGNGTLKLTTGLGPTILGYGLEGAVKFGIYESLKPVFTNLMNKDFTDDTFPYLLSSVLAGAAASFVLCPMEAIRIKMVTSDDHRNYVSVSVLDPSTISQCHEFRFLYQAS